MSFVIERRARNAVGRSEAAVEQQSQLAVELLVVSSAQGRGISQQHGGIVLEFQETAQREVVDFQVVLFGADDEVVAGHDVRSLQRLVPVQFGYGRHAGQTPCELAVPPQPVSHGDVAVLEGGILQPAGGHQALPDGVDERLVAVGVDVPLEEELCKEPLGGSPNPAHKRLDVDGLVVDPHQGYAVLGVESGVVGRGRRDLQAHRQSPRLTHKDQFFEREAEVAELVMRRAGRRVVDLRTIERRQHGHLHFKRGRLAAERLLESQGVAAYVDTAGKELRVVEVAIVEYQAVAGDGAGVLGDLHATHVRGRGGYRNQIANAEIRRVWIIVPDRRAVDE